MAFGRRCGDGNWRKPALNLAAISIALTCRAAAADDTQKAACATYDWAGVGWNRDADATLSKRPDNQRVVFMGDSITQKWSVTPFISSNPHYVGRGLGGQTASQMLVRFRSDVVNVAPAVVHIMAGTNDVARNNGPETASEIAGYIISMVELAKANHIRVVLALTPPASTFPWRAAVKPQPEIAQVNQLVRSYAIQHHVTVVDYGQVLGNGVGGVKPGLTLDGVHPSPAGYAAMQPLAEKAIASALKEPLSR